MASSLWPDSESKRNAARRVRRFSSVRDLRMDCSLSISCSLNWTGLRFLGKGMTPLKHKLDQMYRYLENDDLVAEDLLGGTVCQECESPADPRVGSRAGQIRLFRPAGLFPQGDRRTFRAVSGGGET